MNNIVVGVDRSDTARRAAETAAMLAARTDATLHLVTSISRTPGREVRSGGDRRHVDATSDAETYLKDLARVLPHDRITTNVALGDPAATMCEAATHSTPT